MADAPSRAPIFERAEPLLLAGISVPLPPKSAPPPERPRVIQELVRSLMARAEEIKARIGAERYMVIDGDVFESEEPPRVRAHVAVRSFDGLPAWCESVTVEAGRFAVFRHRGPPKNLGQTVTRIHVEWVPLIPELFRSNRELFVYPPGYDPADPEAVFEYWLPL